ncbi:DUF4259 domain-containing protein [Streptomyces sp. NPDC088810]|uniref:DUF4259 domain-containing protein n=1 Tax=Streptomyces sp. NPDC088810 TaxID=3365904 RepID=UPI0037F8C5E0
MEQALDAAPATDPHFVRDSRIRSPGTWGTGPFDSDLAADFVDELEGLTHQQIIDVLARAFQRVTDSGERVDGGDGAEAVTAGALAAGTLSDSPLIDPGGPPEPGCERRGVLPFAVGALGAGREAQSRWPQSRRSASPAAVKAVTNSSRPSLKWAQLS